MGTSEGRGVFFSRVTLPVVLLAGVVLGALALAPAAMGQGDEIEITSQEVESDFPNQITFKLAATGPDPIEEVRVFLKPAGSESSTYGYLDIVPGGEVSGEYVMPTGGANHKPPGTLVRYSFELRDAAGRVLRTEDQEFLYMDSSLEWKEIADEEGLLTVYYYGEFVETRARTVMDAARTTMRNMGGVLGIQPVDPVTIVAYSNYRDMVRGLPFRSQAVREELQTEGQAYPVERVLLVLASEATVTGVASHEFTHILVAEAAGAGYLRVPAWLNEGLAEYGNLDQTPHYDQALAYGIFTRRLRPLWYLSEFGGEPEDILVAYGHGKSVVAYLIQRYGEKKMADLMSAFASGLSVDDALVQVYGFDQYGLDTEWRGVLGLEPFPPPEELARQAARTPGATPAPGAEATRAPTLQAEATPVPEPEAASRTTDGRQRTTRSCGGAPVEGANVPVDVAAFALLAGPLIVLPFRRRTLVERVLRKLGAKGLR